MHSYVKIQLLQMIRKVPMVHHICQLQTVLQDLQHVPQPSQRASLDPAAIEQMMQLSLEQYFVKTTGNSKTSKKLQKNIAP